jgi:hypothetical protein
VAVLGGNLDLLVNHAKRLLAVVILVVSAELVDTIARKP